MGVPSSLKNIFYKLKRITSLKSKEIPVDEMSDV
jgi:hypothetical protein